MTSLLFSKLGRVIKSYGHTCNNTLVHTCNVIETSVSAMLSYYFFGIMVILKAVKSHFKGSYDKQNLTLVVISYEIYETDRRPVS